MKSRQIRMFSESLEQMGLLGHKYRGFKTSGHFAVTVMLLDVETTPSAYA